MNIKVPINTVLEECKRCPNFQLNADNLFEFNRIETIVYKCAYVDICENAIELYKKHVEAEKNNEET